MLDCDLAELYGVKTFVLNQAVKRNCKRFPSDFMFRLNNKEYNNLKDYCLITNLKSQFVMSSWGGRRALPYAFTEQGIAMLSGILKSNRAILVNIAIMRAFVKLRQIISANKELSAKLTELERKIENHDADIQAIFNAIRKLMDPAPEKPKGRIGFV